MTLLLEGAIKVSLLIVVGLGLTSALRGRSAATRHWVLATTILCALALPVLEAVVPAWRVSILEPAPRRSAVSRSVSPEVSASIRDSVVTAAPSTSSSPRESRRSVEGVLAAMWMVGTAISLLVLLAGLSRLAWLAARARRLHDGPWVEMATRIQAALPQARPARLLQSDHPALLVTWGVTRPTILLPLAAQHWESHRIRIVLQHELAHIRRGDWIAQIAGELLRAACWFNPLVWLACARLRQESEQACDDEVLAAGVEGSDYATELLEMARLLKAGVPQFLPAPAIARPSGLERRVRAMLNIRVTRTPAPLWIKLGTVAALLTIAVGIAAAQSGPVTLSGSVSDPSGAGVPGAKVVLTNSQAGATFEVTTDADGQFAFVPLPADRYGLNVRMPGFTTLAEEVSLTGATLRRDLRLSLGTLSETIAVGPGGTLKAHDVEIFDDNGGRRRFSRLEMKIGESVTGSAVGVSAAEGGAALQRELASCVSSPAGGRVRPPNKIKDVRPVYPAHLQDTGTGGTVVLKGTIGTDGTFRELQVVTSAHPELDSAALDAVRQWKYDGALLNCSPTEVDITTSVDFTPK